MFCKKVEEPQAQERQRTPKITRNLYNKTNIKLNDAREEMELNRKTWMENAVFPLSSDENLTANRSKK